MDEVATLILQASNTTQDRIPHPQLALTEMTAAALSIQTTYQHLLNDTDFSDITFQMS
jgi:hypothetical protein